MALITCYTIGTLFGMWIGYKSGVKQGAHTTIETLIATQYLRSRKGEDGEVQILRPDEENV